MPISAMLPLAQMNSTTAPGTGGMPAAPAVAPSVGPAAPAVGPATHTAVEGGGGGGAAPGLNAATQGSATQGSATQPGGAIKPDSIFNSLMMPMLILVFIALYFFMTRGQKKEEKRRKSLLSEMKKGDKVQTIGGLVARIVSIDNDEVVLKVDESANVKAVYKKSAIATVIVPADEKGK